jgi:hypothetical protein
MKVPKFHQFIRVEKGPLNSAIINFLTGDIYQVQNDYLEKFEKGQCNDIEEFLRFCMAEQLVIEVDENRWIPPLLLGQQKDKKTVLNSIVTLEIEEGADLQLVVNSFKHYEIRKIFYYGNQPPVNLLNGVKVFKKTKNPDACEIISRIDHEFLKTNENEFESNLQYNSCWGGKISITADNIARPCIYST